MVHFPLLSLFLKPAVVTNGSIDVLEHVDDIVHHWVSCFAVNERSSHVCKNVQPMHVGSHMS